MEEIVGFVVPESGRELLQVIEPQSSSERKDHGEGCKSPNKRRGYVETARASDPHPRLVQRPSRLGSASRSATVAAP